MGKFYAVKKGRQTGIFSTWNECQRQISGFSGAEYKSFLTRAEAEKYIGKETEKIDMTNGVHIYVDGSFNVFTKQYGSAYVILYPQEDGFPVAIFSEEAYSNPEYAVSRNVAGEIFSVINALEQIDKMNGEGLGLNELVIHYDYEGLAKWADGEWRANKKLSQMYADTVKKYRQNGMKIVFVHEKAHTGVEYNEIVDKLAKRAVGVATREELAELEAKRFYK